MSTLARRNLHVASDRMAPAPPNPLERFVPRLASEWERDVGDAVFQERDGTLCFVDISGFTSLSERLALQGRIGVEELTEVLNRVFGAMLEIAFTRGGSLLKFGGDALLLMFEGPNHPLHGAAAAIEMRSALRTASQMPMSVGRVQLRMSVGLHAGPVLLFRPGSLHHELIVTGPAATRTTLVEHAASAGDILVSPEMARRLPPTATRPGPGDTAMLRWRHAPLESIEVRPRQPVPSLAVERCLPAVLRDHLRPGEVEFEHRIAALAFLRFQGVDSLLARRGPEETAAALDEMVSTVQEAAEQLEVAFLATDLDADGGKIVLVSGVPSAQPDHAGRILRVVRRVADARLQLPMQIGLNHGHVFAGTIGAQHRATFTVMGDTVNLAARLMAAAPLGEIYASPAVLDRARPIFATRSVAPFLVKGKAKPVTALAVGDEIGTRGAPDERGPFVGREAELRGVAASLPGPISTSDRVLTIVGDTGVGKSRLALEALAKSEVAVVTISGEPDGTSTPYRACRDAVRSLLGVERADQQSMCHELSAALRRVDPSLMPMAPLVGDLAHLDLPTTPEVSSIDPKFLSDHRARVLIRLLDHLRPLQTTVLVEDAQWVDAASGALLTRMAEAIDSRPEWSMLVLRREGEGGFTPEGTVLNLSGLPERDVRGLVNALAPTPLRPDEVDRLVHRAAGSPLVVKALISLVAGHGDIDDLPDSLEAVLAAEIDVVSPVARQLLRYAAVLGRSFDLPVWDRLLAADGLERSEVSTGELQRFLEVGAGGAARFRQAVVRDAAYRGLPYRRRRTLHLRAGQVIEETAPDGLEAVADRLSVHFHEGGDAAQAWRYARMAGRRAQQSYANDDAAALFRRALDAARHLEAVAPDEQRETWTALGDVLAQAGRLDEALAAYRRATAMARHVPVEHARLLLRRARVRERSGAYVAALRELTSAERVVEAERGLDAEAERVALATMRAIVHEGQEQPHRALAAAQRAVASAEAAGQPEQMAKAYSVMDWAHVYLGELDQAVHEPLVVEIHRAQGNPHRAAAALGNHGAVQFWLGRWGEALDCYRQAHEAYVLTGDVVNAATQQANLAELLINRGDLLAAREAVVEAGRTHRAVGFVDGALFDEIQLGRLLLREGDPEAAAALLRLVVDEARGLGLVGTALEAAVHLAECQVAQGNTGEALDTLAMGEEAAGADATLFEASIAAVRSRALAAAGDGAAAQRERTAGIAVARRLQLHYELGDLLLMEVDEPSREEGKALLSSLGIEIPELTE